MTVKKKREWCLQRVSGKLGFLNLITEKNNLFYTVNNQMNVIPSFVCRADCELSEGGSGEQ